MQYEYLPFMTLYPCALKNQLDPNSLFCERSRAETPFFKKCLKMSQTDFFSQTEAEGCQRDETVTRLWHAELFKILIRSIALVRCRGYFFTVSFSNCLSLSQFELSFRLPSACGIYWGREGKQTQELLAEGGHFSLTPAFYVFKNWKCLIIKTKSGTKKHKNHNFFWRGE